MKVIFEGDVLIENDIIVEISESISANPLIVSLLMPKVII
jgi:hypothetical protein